jgi:transcriptional regulator with XRE-family HTH domain
MAELGIRRLRVAAGLTATAVADKLGVSCPTLSLWETGDRVMPVEQQARAMLAIRELVAERDARWAEAVAQFGRKP